MGFLLRSLTQRPFSLISILLLSTAPFLALPASALASKGEASLRSSSVLPGPLVSVTELKLLVDRKAVTVLDTRELLQSDQKTPNFEAGHIPGALPAPYSSFRSQKDNPGQAPSAERLSQIAGHLGIRPNMPIVLAGSGSDPTEFGGVARIYWNLKIAGFDQLAILNGGFGAWLAAGYPVATGPATFKPQAVSLTLRTRMIPSTQAISQRLSQPNKPLLLDARPEDFFTGETRHALAARWGTLPGAQHLDSEEWFIPNTGRLLSREALLQRAQSEGLLGKTPVVAFCNTGHWAATHWFVLSELLGQQQTQLYPDSVVGWSNAGLPMDNEPTRAIALLRQAQGKGIQP